MCYAVLKLESSYGPGDQEAWGRGVDAQWDVTEAFISPANEGCNHL